MTKKKTKLEQERELFISEHIKSCKVGRENKYWKKQPNAYYTLETSRRRCAMRIWREKQKQKNASTIKPVSRSKKGKDKGK